MKGLASKFLYRAGAGSKARPKASRPGRARLLAAVVPRRAPRRATSAPRDARVVARTGPVVPCAGRWLRRRRVTTAAIAAPATVAIATTSHRRRRPVIHPCASPMAAAYFHGVGYENYVGPPNVPST